METLTKMVSETAGISEQQANNVINTVVNFLKSKLPEEIGEQLEAYVSGDQSDGFEGMVDDLKDTLTGVYEKKP